MPFKLTTRSIRPEGSVDLRRDAGTILHVEDSAGLRTARNRALERGGFRVVEATTVAAAWEAALRERPDAVLTDVKLPDGDGYELTRRIKSDISLATTRVVQISAVFVDAESRVRGLESGADGYIIEPTEPAELVAIMRSMVRGRRTEELFGTLLDGSPMLVAGADVNGNVAVFNAACEDLTGLPRTEVIGRPFLDALVHPADRDVVARRFEAASSEELALPHENRWRTAGGDAVDIEWRCFRVVAPDGSSLILGMGNDVTARNRADAAFRESQARLHAIIDNTTAVIYMMDTANRFLLINRHFEELFGIPRAQALGKSIHDWFTPDVAAQFEANNARVFEAGVTCEFEERVPQADGVHTFISMKTPLYDESGRAYALSGVSTDITERKRMSDALQAAQRAKDYVIATVAHELKQPLAAIQTAHAMMRTDAPPRTLERARTVAERQVAHIGRLVDDLLDASRIARGKVTLKRQRTTLNTILDGAVTVVQPLVEERKLSLTVDVPADLIWMEADVARLQQVFSNLLTNAAKFTDPGGRILVATDADEGGVTVRVRDSGCGIEPHVLPHIFDLFSQGSTDERGLGIGLTVVRGLVEQHGGTVEARSEGPGRGSEFIVRLPRVAAAV
jgi:PAS domain S-box-containing protein